jgi:uncharacterized protein
MQTLTRGTVLVAAALSIATLARADFQSALKDYNAGQFDAAHGEFLALAELGDCSSQFNLGAMALKGQGGPQDTASGVGWLKAAAGNGCEKLVGNRLPALEARLSPDQSQAAALIVGRYGREALRAQGVVDPDFSCRELTPASVYVAPTPEYPRQLTGKHVDAIVITALTIGPDGHARDPEVLLAEPAVFAPSAVEAWLNTLFTPANRDGHAVVSRLEAKQVFSSGQPSDVANIDALKAARPAADSGEPRAAYLVGLTATLDTSLGISSARAGQLLLNAARDGGAPAQYWVASQLRASSACHPRADGEVWLRHAAEGGSAPAQLALARDLLTTPDAAHTAEARALLAKAALADDYYVRKHVAALLAASPLEAIHDAATARSIAQQLAAGAIQSDPQMFEVLAAAAAANGDFHGAVGQEEVALRKAQSLGWDTRAQAERLNSYRAGKLWHGDLFAL